MKGEELPKRYVPKEHEPKWQKFWEERGIYRFDSKDRHRPTYAIDTPPPYPSGEFHMGNALNWCYLDFVARYKRMKGYNVHFPQGWDCHGLPTEVRAETKFKVRKKDVPIEKFKDLCVQLTLEYIDKMRNSMKKVGYSIDWSLEYKTMDPQYYKLTQLSFVLLYEAGKLYRGRHPVNWCPRCETAIAEAEVEYVERSTTLNHIRFKVDGGGYLQIATTRPELLPACVAVAVNPEDERYRGYVGKNVEVPLFKRKVKVLSDMEVDPEFGTGVVMVCTFGDKTDVKWQKRYGLPEVIVITEDGRMNEKAGKYAGLTVQECRKAIIEDLREAGALVKEETINQSVGTCWRCHSPIEILPKPQWFMKTKEMTDEVIEWSNRVEWVPQFARKRMIDWALSLDWDWVISRQRVFATPIPVWYCKKCGEIIVAKKDWLPVDPRFEKPRIRSCPKCGSKDFVGETDVMDTWMDSSITCAVHAGWPDDPDSFRRLFPADLQPNGLDIIRTWDYYLMVKHLALFGKAPYKTVLINGMVRGADGRMMHKSYGNYVEADEVVEKYGADALRQWAAGGGSTGSDVPFRWSDVEYGKKFLTKLWNAARFVLMNLNGFKIEENKRYELEVIDKWLLSKLEKLTGRVTEAFERFQFNVAIESLRNFTWHVFCDHYLEAIKPRLYSSIEEEGSGEAARYTLLRALFRILQLLAPICPHITESIYQNIKDAVHGEESIHLTKWPEVDETFISEEDERAGELIIKAISLIRKLKAENKLSLKAPLRKAVIHAREADIDIIKTNLKLIKQVCAANLVEIKPLKEKEAEIKVEIQP